jgi:hypothetical protein
MVFKEEITSEKKEVFLGPTTILKLARIPK